MTTSPRTGRPRISYSKGGIESLRKQVLERALGVSAIAAPSVAAIFCIGAWLQDSLNTLTVVLSAYTLQFPLLYTFRNKLRYRTCGMLFIEILLIMAIAIQLRGGVGAAPLSLQLLILVLSGVLFGRRGLQWTLIMTLTGFGFASFGVLGGFVPPIMFELWDPNLPNVWIRSAIILTLFGGAAALCVTYMLGELDAEANLLREALAREQEQRTARERAEAEREATRVALREAEHAETIGRLAGGVAHDYNNALTMILAAAEAIRADPLLAGESRACLDDITQTAFQSASLTRTLLALGRKDLAPPRVIDVGEQLCDLVSRLRRMLPPQTELILDDTGEVGTIIADPAQFDRAVTNLILNARDAISERGEIRLSANIVELLPGMHGLPGGPYVAIHVCDDGEGMSDAVQRQIFDPFFSTKHRQRGSGIGMSVVQGFVADVHGAIDIRSREGAGTLVTLLLPPAGVRAHSERPLPLDPPAPDLRS